MNTFKDYYNSKINKVLIKKVHGLNVYTVNGSYIRDNIDVDFIGGGNGYAHSYIPKNEIWIEEDFKQSDVDAFIHHELVELERMNVYHEPYRVAHNAANKAERKYRDTN